MYPRCLQVCLGISLCDSLLAHLLALPLTFDMLRSYDRTLHTSLTHLISMATTHDASLCDTDGSMQPDPVYDNTHATTHASNTHATSMPAEWPDEMMFTVPVEVEGKMCEHPLVPDGAKIAVTPQVGATRHVHVCCDTRRHHVEWCVS